MPLASWQGIGRMGERRSAHAQRPSRWHIPWMQLLDSSLLQSRAIHHHAPAFQSARVDGRRQPAASRANGNSFGAKACPLGLARACATSLLFSTSSSTSTPPRPPHHRIAFIYAAGPALRGVRLTLENTACASSMSGPRKVRARSISD